MRHQKHSKYRKKWTTPVRLESPKIKIFQPPDFEMGFAIYSGAESNSINVNIQREIHTSYPKLPIQKLLSKLTTPNYKLNNIWKISFISHTKKNDETK